MKNNVFRKATALAIGSLVFFSGQALAIASNQQKIIDADALNNSEIIIAQDGIEACAQVEFAVNILGEVITGVEQVEEFVELNKLEEIPPQFRDSIVTSLKEAIKTMAEARVIAEQDEDSQLVITITTVIAVLDQVAEAIAQGQVGQLEVLNGARADAQEGCEFQ